MSYAILASADEDENYSENVLLNQVNGGTASKHCKELDTNTSWKVPNSPNYRNTKNETISANNKNRNTENRRPKMRKVLLSKEYKCRCETAPKCTGACKPRGYRVISQGAQDAMGKSTLKNDCSRPKYVVTKRDPKLRPLEEVTLRKFKRREHVVIRNDQQASCSSRKLQKQEKVEKMTYCRPVLDFVNEDSVAKNAERNNRLQNIVQKLIEVRQIQKQRETWNNFINELKTRHELNAVHTIENEVINDYGNVRFNVPPAVSKPVRYYIEDMYPHSSSMVEQELKSNIYDYQSKLDNSHLLYGAHPYLCYPNMSVKGKTSKQANHTYDYIVRSEPKRQVNDFYTPRQKYKRKTEYIPSDVSVPSKDSDNDYPLTDNEQNRTREASRSKYRQYTDRVASRRTTCNSEMVHRPVTPRSPGQRKRNQAIKTNTDRGKYSSPTINKTKNNVSDYRVKHKQMEYQYKNLFEDIAEYKEQNQDDKSHATLENIENKLDLLIQGISELLQEIKPKYNLIHDEIKLPDQYFEEEEHIRCRNCIGNDSVLSFITNKIHNANKQEISNQTVPKREITKNVCKNVCKNVTLPEDNESDDECDLCCKYSFSCDRFNTLKTCNYKQEVAHYDKHKLYDVERSKEYDKCSVHDNSPFERYDRRRQDNDTTTDIKDQSSSSYCLKSKLRAKTSTPVQENVSCRKQSYCNKQINDTYGRNGVTQDVELGKRRVYDDMQNEIHSRLKTKQKVDEEYEQLKNAQSEENGKVKRKSWNKSKQIGVLSQKCDEQSLKLCKTEHNESYDTFGAASTSGHDKNSRKEHNTYAEDKTLFLDKASARFKSDADRKQQYVRKTQNVLPLCRRSMSSERKQDTDETSEENPPSSERRGSTMKETERDCVRDMFKNIRREDLDKRTQNSNDAKESRLMGQISESDTRRQSSSLQITIKNPEPPNITGILSKSGPNAERRYNVQDFIKQTWKYETETCQTHMLKVDASDTRIFNKREEKKNEKDVCLVVKINRDCDTKFDPKTNKDSGTEQDQDCAPMLCLQRGLRYDDTLERESYILESCSNLVTRKSYIDCSTSANRIINVSRGSSPDVGAANRYGFKKRDHYSCAVVENHGSPFCNKHRYENSKMEKIIIEEMNKSDQAKRDIENILIGEFSDACAVSFSFDVPTRERSTEVTNSLCAAVPHRLDELCSYDSASRTITTVAVNTDPMGFLALLRLSTDTIKYLLGQMNLDRLCSPLAYITQLSIPRSLPLPNLVSIQKDIPGFICNICGSVFPTRSQLSLHNIDHRNELYRGCCVCRHLLDMRKRRHAGLFTCVYCGQCFTRAYCCELHQHVCARKRGLKHDVVQRLSILR